MLKIYYSQNYMDLIHLESQATWWMPEHLTTKPSPNQLYQLGNTIVTTHKMVVTTAIERIKANLLPAQSLLVYQLDNHPPIVQLFQPDGTVKDFWPINSEAAQTDKS